MTKKGITFKKHRHVAQRTIISDELAEKFISRWMRRNKSNRKGAIERLRKLGVSYPTLKSAASSFLRRVA